MQQSLALEDATEVSERRRHSTALGKGLRLELENAREGRAVLYRGDFPIKTVDLGDKVARKLFLTEAMELGATQSRLAKALDVSRQTLHNYREIKERFGVVGLIDGYRMADGTDAKEQRVRHEDQHLPGNKAQQVAAIRAEEKACSAAAHGTLNFSFEEEEGHAKKVAHADQPFTTEHDWEASRYAGCFAYWPTLVARWRWLELVMGHFGAGWRIFAVFVLMAGRDIRSIEQLKNVRAKEAARVLGLANLGAKTRVWEWFYTVSRQGSARALLADYCRYQIRAGLVGGWIWFTDGHLLPYTGKQKVHYSYNTQRRMPVPGRTNQVTCDGSGRIVDFEIQEGKGTMKQWILDVADKWQPELATRPVAVFDREGYDAGFFFRLVSDDRPFVSWQKNVDAQRLATIDAKRFSTDFTFNAKHYSVFEQPKAFSYTDEQGETHAFTLRHIHLWNRSTNRRTGALVHADPTLLSLEEATRAILSRWGASENTFKHLQERHPAHYQPGFKLVESERQDIANPDIKPLEKRIGRLGKELGKLYKKLSKTPESTNKDGSVRRNSQRRRLQETIKRKEQELEDLREDKGRLPERVDVSTLQNYRSFKQVDNEGKYLFDFVTAAVWNARKQMVDWLRAYYDYDNEVVDLFYAITHCHGWVHNSAEVVTVRLEPLQQAKRRAAQEQFCRKLTALGAQTPLGKRLVVEVGESPLQ